MRESSKRSAMNIQDAFLDFSLRRWVVAVGFLSALIWTIQASPLVREMTSRATPPSQVIQPEGTKDISLILDREEYDPLDVTGVAVVSLRAAGEAVDRLRAEAE